MGAPDAQVAAEALQRRRIAHLEGEMIDAGAVGPAQYDAVVVALVPGLEIDAAGTVPSGFDEPQHVAIKMDRPIEVGHPQLRVSGPQHAGQSHYIPPCPDRFTLFSSLSDRGSGDAYDSASRGARRVFT